jgi:predicted nucleic acid-binding protein
LRVALDTNILACAEGVNGAVKKKAALDILEKLPVGSVSVPVQALGELFNLLVRKAGKTPKDARATVLHWRNALPTIDTSSDVLLAASDLAMNQFSIWDAVMVCAAAEGECRLLLSEDMQDGFVWKGVTIANPFSKPMHPLLDALLSA